MRRARDRVFLVGFMAAGKSAVGRAFARLEGRPFVDTDGLVSALSRRSVAAVFAAEGEAGFRRREAAALARAARVAGAVVAVGGGAVTRAANVRLMRRTGTVVWLQAGWKTLEGRAKRDGTASRPLWAKGRALLAARRPLYARAAHLRLRSGLAPSIVAARLARRLKESL